MIRFSIRVDKFNESIAPGKFCRQSLFVRFQTRRMVDPCRAMTWIACIANDYANLLIVGNCRFSQTCKSQVFKSRDGLEWASDRSPWLRGQCERLSFKKSILFYRVLVKFGDSQPPKLVAPTQASDQYEWNQDQSRPENQSLPNCCGVAESILKTQILRRVIFLDIGEALCHWIVSESAEQPERHSTQTESSIWQGSNETNASLRLSVGSPARVWNRFDSPRSGPLSESGIDAILAHRLERGRLATAREQDYSLDVSRETVATHFPDGLDMRGFRLDWSDICDYLIQKDMHQPRLMKFEQINDRKNVYYRM
jgi:hypothetical protein